MGAGSIFQKNRPSGYIGKGDKYIPRFSEELSKILSKEIKSLSQNALKLSKTKLLELSILIMEFAEDIHTDLGFWKSYEEYNIGFFGKKHPPFSSLNEKSDEDKFNCNRIRHLLSYLYTELKPELLLSPAHKDIEYLSKIISLFLNEKMKIIPKDTGIQYFLSQPNNEAGDVKRKLIWLGTKCYLFRMNFTNYLIENETKISIGNIDDFICQENTKLSGLGVIDILADTLNINNNQKNELRSWHERHFAFYKVLSKTETNLEVLNLINNKKYIVNAKGFISNFKIDQIISGGLIPWDNMWYWSGEQKLLGNLSSNEIDDIRKTFLRKYSKIAFRYDNKLLQKSKQFLKVHFEEFLEYFKNDLVIFSDGLEMASEIQKKEGLNYKSKLSKKELEAFMKKHDLKNPSSHFTYPESLIESSNGIGVFFNPDEGQEIAVDFNNIVTGFKKQGNGLNSDEENAIIYFIKSNSLSVNFVNRLVHEHGSKSILSSFMIRNCDDEIALEYILRKYKGMFYRNRYPSISIIE